ncbi:anti-sigma factor domain-containing protein [Saccharopolyspora sp. CA-218241]
MTARRQVQFDPAPLPPGAQALAVTVEPAGGSAQPIADPVLTLSL